MGLRRFFRRAKWDRERTAEIESYIQIETDDNLARGMTEADARAAARRKFGNPTSVREEIYHMNTVSTLDSAARDIRYGLRMLRHNPMFTVVALITLALGIGANTAVFSVVNSVLIKPLAYPRADELVAVWQKAPGAAGLANISGDLRLSASMFTTYSEQNRTLQAMGVWTATTATVTGLAEPEQVRAVLVSEGALEALGVPPVAGRWLAKADQKPGAAATIMLGYGYWQRRFGGENSVIGRKILVDSKLREVIGVMPQTFRVVNEDADLIVPLAFDRAELILPGFGFQGVARLKPGVTIAQADADLARLVPVWMNSWPAPPGLNPHVWEAWRITPALRPLKQDVVGGVGGVLWVLMGTIGIVMLIACANVANLLLVRADARQQELAVRAALGAGWGQIVRALLLESMLLGCIGGALGVGLAYAGLRWLVSIGPGRLPRLNEIAVDTRALAFAVAISLVSGVLFGLAPALKYAGPRIAQALRGGGRTSSHGRERHRARNVLVVAQVALALVLLISSGLMIRTFQALRSVEPGFTRPEQVQVVRISIPPSLIPEPERTARMQNQIADKLSAIPGVSSVAFASEVPMDGIETDWDAIQVEGRGDVNAQVPPMRVFHSISPGLFATMGTRMVAGRDYTWTDLYGRRPVAILSENLARELWGSAAAAVGKRISASVPNSPWREVIGVVQDVRENGLQEPAPAAVYWPSFGENIYRAGRLIVARDVTIAIRSSRAASESFLGDVHRAVWSVNASLPLASVQTMRDVYDQSMARTSFTLVMLGIAGGMALVLGIVGIYGVMSYAVSQRRREIGIRLALGAQQPALRRMFVRHGLRLSAVGVAVGLCASAGLMRLMKSLLFGISPLDPVTYAAVPMVLAAAAMIASYLPARRAASVDPVEALRAE
jgi:predicted permease